MDTYIKHWEQSVEEDKNSQNVETQRSERTTSPAWGAQTKPKRGVPEASTTGQGGCAPHVGETPSP